MTWGYAHAGKNYKYNNIYENTSLGASLCSGSMPSRSEIINRSSLPPHGYGQGWYHNKSINHACSNVWSGLAEIRWWQDVNSRQNYLNNDLTAWYK